jgi:hypothetical protein
MSSKSWGSCEPTTWEYRAPFLPQKAPPLLPTS